MCSSTIGYQARADAYTLRSLPFTHEDDEDIHGVPRGIPTARVIFLLKPKVKHSRTMNYLHDQFS